VSAATLKILLVEDSAGDARLIREMLRDEPPDSFELTHLVRMSDAVSHLAKATVHIALLDMGLPDAHGLDSVRRAREAAPDVPVIVLTGLDDEALAAEAMKAGAQDYLIKNQIGARALPRALRYAIARHRMQIESDRIREQQMQFKDEFLAHVSHELRSPLGAIYQFVTILRDRLAGDLTLSQQECVDILHRNVTQLRSMINDLLEVSHVHAGKVTIEQQCMSVQDAIGYTVNTLQATAAAKKIEFKASAAEDLPLVWADPMRVRQMLIILADNALKFTPADGGVTIAARWSEQESSFVVIEVADSGPGIALDVIDQVFDRLFQASAPDSAGRRGLGLGLYICRELVTRQGGEVWATSTPGQGAKFYIKLPVFSLSDLIAPTLKLALGGPLVLSVTEMASKAGWLSGEARVESSRVLRDLLLTCLEPELEALLPKMGSAGATDLFFIVSGALGTHGVSLAQRIRDQIASSESIRRMGLQFDISTRMVGTIDASRNERNESAVGRLVAEIQQRVDEELSSRMMQHE
jgi:sigma-B regulation protein RsbU (phosphoserine phosphatase)